MTIRTHPYHHGDLRAALLDATESLIREHGIAALSLRAVARRAGVSHAAPAHHFRHKIGLLTAFATLGYERLAQSVVAAVARAGAFEGRRMLQAVGEGYVAFALRHPEQFALMFRLDQIDAADPVFMSASDAAYGLLIQTVESCAAEGTLGRQDPEIVAVAAWSMVHGLSHLWLSGRLAGRIRETDPARLAHDISRLFVERVLG